MTVSHISHYLKSYRTCVRNMNIGFVRFRFRLVRFNLFHISLSTFYRLQKPKICTAHQKECDHRARNPQNNKGKSHTIRKDMHTYRMDLERIQKKPYLTLVYYKLTWLFSFSNDFNSMPSGKLISQSAITMMFIQAQNISTKGFSI